MYANRYRGQGTARRSWHPGRIAHPPLDRQFARRNFLFRRGRLRATQPAVNSGTPLSAARAVWIIGRLALRRQLNIWQSVRLARHKKRAEAKRSGTPAKSSKRSLFSVFVIL